MRDSEQIVQQIIRPTGLVDPEVEVRPIEGQLDDLLGEIKGRAARNERVLVTTLTKKMAEDLTEFLKETGIKVRYLHSDIATIERGEIIRDLRAGVFDVLVGINLLREGLDLPEVSLVAILDADKEGFLRSETSMIQTIGRAARNAHGRVIMYANHQTGSMKRAIDETTRRRNIQLAHNKKYGIIPQTIVKKVRDLIQTTKVAEAEAPYEPDVLSNLSKREMQDLTASLEKEMKAAAKALEFERAGELRDEIKKLKQKLGASETKAKTTGKAKRTRQTRIKSN